MTERICKNFKEYDGKGNKKINCKYYNNHYTLIKYQSLNKSINGYCSLKNETCKMVNE